MAALPPALIAPPSLAVSNQDLVSALEKAHEFDWAAANAYGHSSRIFAQAVRDPFVCVPDDLFAGGDCTSYVLKRCLGETGASMSAMERGRRPLVTGFIAELQLMEFAPLPRTSLIKKEDVVLYCDVLHGSATAYHVAVVHSITEGEITVRSQYLDWGIVEHPIASVRRRDDASVGVYSVFRHAAVASGVAAAAASI